MRIRYGNGIELECGGRLLIDPKFLVKGVPTLISHAHYDHVPKNLREVRTRVLVTEGTSSILRKLYGGNYEIIHFGEEFRLGDFEIYAFPAGHIFGSAGFLVNCGKISLFYTGDVNPHGGLTVESPAETPKADVLVIEATYGHPKFKFPDPDVIRARLAKWVVREVIDGRKPILSAYLVGKSQEVIATLNKYTNVELSVSRGIARVSEAYEKFSLKYTTEREESMAHVTHAARSKNCARVTGWVLFSKRESDFPLSAHADFYDLLDIVERSSSKMVFTVHGFASYFAQILKKMGIEAEKLGENWVEL